jgi:hypothetical protein
MWLVTQEMWPVETLFLRAASPEQPCPAAATIRRFYLPPAPEQVRRRRWGSAAMRALRAAALALGVETSSWLATPFW